MNTIALSLGPPSEPSALAVVATPLSEPGRPSEHAVRLIQRFLPGTAYASIRGALQAAVDAVETPTVIIDRTAVGDAIAFVFNGWRVTLTNGFRDQDHIPRRDVAASLQMALQGDRVRVAKGPLSAELQRQFPAFNPRPSAAGPDAIAWRDRPGDDLILAVALAVWYADPRATLRPETLFAFGPMSVYADPEDGPDWGDPC